MMKYSMYVRGLMERGSMLDNENITLEHSIFLMIKKLPGLKCNDEDAWSQVMTYSMKQDTCSMCLSTSVMKSA